ncbi:MAG: hypothetical protein K9H61_09860 [Bacteroidia bacterium]|nr:hypothetical protein [Bacteroidia bacterium]MCF8427414.1 hypothetical protein [Bacteroidia bacterium]MCF8447287.1 hypothetical protein [Bacteroidia bacterium]
MSKAKIIELDVDFIGGERSLTKEDEQAISDFLKRKNLQSKIAQRAKKTTKRPKSLA